MGDLLQQLMQIFGGQSTGGGSGSSPLGMGLNQMQNGNIMQMIQQLFARNKPGNATAQQGGGTINNMQPSGTNYGVQTPGVLGSATGGAASTGALAGAVPMH